MPEPTGNAVKQANEAGQSIWLDMISREMIASGELDRLVDLGISGVTSNPTIFEKAMAEGAAYDDALALYAEAGGDAGRAFEGLAVEDIRNAADVLRRVYERTNGEDGFVSIEVSPTLAHDTDATIEEGRRLFSSIDRPNVMVKVPGTPEGMPAIRTLISEGVNVNVTLLFSLDAYRNAAKAYIDGLQAYVASGKGSPERVASVASFFVSRVDSSIDKLLDEAKQSGRADDVDHLKGKIGIANAKLAYAEFQRVFEGDAFSNLAKRQAQRQRPLWASTSVKNPEYPDTMYMDNLIGPYTVNTIPPATLTAFLEQGDVRETITKDVDEARAQVAELERVGISLDAVTDDLLKAGVKAFADSYKSLLDGIEMKLGRLEKTHKVRGKASFGDNKKAVDRELSRLQSEAVAGRIWRKDASVWPEPAPGGAAVKDRLGWLSLADQLPGLASELSTFAAEVRDEGFTDAVLLGMGGSSMSSEVLRVLVGSQPGWLNLHVLDTVHPVTIQTVTDSLDMNTTLFLVSSKSGTTIEPLTLEKHFRTALTSAGVSNAPAHFVAVTDPGSTLSERTRAGEFRRAFEAPPDVGGRYSALSVFGMLPAALMGLDLERMGASASAMSEACSGDSADNPGLWLGAALGILAAAGRDKVTLLTTPGLERLGLWIEQLLAESTGKNGKGLIPVAGELRYDAANYFSDRQFVYVRLAGADNAGMDALAEDLQREGHQVVRIELPDLDALGGEFFRWEFATAVAANRLDVNPFDEPDVNSSKDRTRKALGNGIVSNDVSDVTLGDSLDLLLGSQDSNDYVAISAFLPESEDLTAAFGRLREAITRRTGMATTFGYGPRYLHSTGQLYKGGPDSVIQVVIVDNPNQDVTVPGENYTLGALSYAQAVGDVEEMKGRGRRAAIVSLSGNYIETIDSLVTEWGESPELPSGEPGIFNG